MQTILEKSTGIAENHTANKHIAGKEVTTGKIGLELNFENDSKDSRILGIEPSNQYIEFPPGARVTVRVPNLESLGMLDIDTTSAAVILTCRKKFRLKVLMDGREIF